jgi:hypothetical protein
VADTFNSEINVGPPPVALPKRRRFGAIGVIAVLLIIGAGGGYLWLTYNESLMEMAHAVTGSTGSQDGTPVLASAPPEGGVSAADFAAFQQQTGSAMQAATDMLTSQQTELKRLSDQIQGLTTVVAGLTSKIDQLPVRPSPQAASPPAATSAAAPALARAIPVGPRKRPTAPKPAGAISVGGAPLPPPAQPIR